MTTKSIGIDAMPTSGGSLAVCPCVRSAVSRRLLLKAAAAGTLAAAGGLASPVEAAAPAARAGARPCGRSPAAGAWSSAPRPRPGSSSRTRRRTSAQRLRRPVRPQAEVVFTEDDLLWYKLKPTPDAPLDFTLRRHPVRLRPSGTGSWSSPPTWSGTRASATGGRRTYLWELDKPDAEELLFGTARAMVRRYRGRAAGWIVANEVTSPSATTPTSSASAPTCRGTRPSAGSTSAGCSGSPVATTRTPPWCSTSSASRPPTSSATTRWPARRRSSASIDTLQRQNVPLDAIGIQAHLLAAYWDSFDPRQYRQVPEADLRPRPEDPDHRDGRAGRRPARRDRPAGPRRGGHLRRLPATPRWPTRRSRR